MQLQHLLYNVSTTFWDYYDDYPWFEFLCRLICFLCMVHLVLFSFSRVVGRTLYFIIPLEKWLCLLGFGFIGLVYCSCWILLYEKKNRSFGFNLPIQRIGLIVLGLVLGILMHCADLSWRYFFMDLILRWNPAWSIENYLQGFFCIFFAAGIEELLFRGYLLILLRYWLGIIPALLITSLLFGVAHLLNEGQPHSEPFIVALVYTFTGLFYGIAFLSSKTIWFPISLHAGGNWLLFSISAGVDKSPLLWLEPLILLENNHNGFNYLNESQCLPVLFVNSIGCYILIQYNKALNRTLRNYFRKSELRVCETG